MYNRRAAIPLALVLVASLGGCSANNDGACQEYETAYNAADLRDKKLFSDSEDFNASLIELDQATEAAAESASGEVKEGLESFSGYAGLYNAIQTDPDVPADTIDTRVDLEIARDDIVDACEERGHPISLEEDRPVK